MIDIVEHKESYCTHCERKIIICGNCGNNTCNAGYGIVDGKQCKHCKDAYELFFKLHEIEICK